MVTTNNPYGEGVRESELLMKISDILKCTYLSYQLELSESGTVHWQGYIELSVARSIRALRKDNDFLARSHLEPRRGSQAQAVEYVTKEDTRIRPVYTEGELAPGQGKRKDLDAVKADIDSGASDIKLWSDHFSSYCRYHKAFKRYKALVQPERRWIMDVRVYWGLTGTGKTRSVYDEFELEEIYSVPHAKGSGTYWDGYDGQKVVLVDEMYGSRFSWGFLLRLTDRYPMTVPIHGDVVTFASKIIIFTSNKHPAEWYQIQANAWSAANPFKRRITTIRSFPDDHEWVPSLEARGRLIPSGVTILQNTSTAALLAMANPVEAIAPAVAIDEEPVDNNNNE